LCSSSAPAPQARVAIAADACSSHDEAGVVVPQLAWKLEVRDDDIDAAMPEFTPDGKWERLGRGEKVGNYTFNQHTVISFYLILLCSLPNTSTPTQAISIHPTKHERFALY
jgi:hypothetical protein